MTTADLLALVWRRWLLVLIGLALTVLAVVRVHDASSVYWAKAEVQVMAPENTVKTNNLTTQFQGQISTAGLVARELDSGELPDVSDKADLPGLGVRDGWLLRVPNAGGQWQPYFDRPVIDVQVVAPSAAAASEKLHRLVAKVQRTLDDLQSVDGVAPKDRMTAEPIPLPAAPLELSGSPIRAEAVTAVLGLWAVLLLVLVAGPVGRGLRRVPLLLSRAGRRRPAPPLAAPALPSR